MPVRFGYHADDEMYQPSRLLDFAKLAEAQGFDFICIDDHFHPWFHRDGHAGHAWIWLSAAGARTKVVPTTQPRATFDLPSTERCVRRLDGMRSAFLGLVTCSPILDGRATTGPPNQVTIG